ncbi:helix-turn-helix domain-containing protein [uncultured Sunxiuqinia sp.]|uniref:helix-turn-helix domain-containing protein n=1 Tax=uncultured Sunxiuqinia sp. TaxID=1573825 RepID=UPI0026194BF3|nr:helix-turn-helix domain-containing protein [uncultured Sunxiuqinia sp.]
MNSHTRIKQLRESKGLSQEELSEKAGLSLRTIQRMENGEGVPRGSTLKNLASSLDVSSDYFSNLPQEKIDKIQSVPNNPDRIKIRIPWYLIGFAIIGGALGFLVGIILMFMKFTSDTQLEGILAITISILFGAIGMVIGNYIEKKNQ